MKIPHIKEAENFVPFQITAQFGGAELGLGTAFHYRHKDREYLVTNWHNVTGREPITYACKDKITLGTPDRLACMVPIRSDDDGHQVTLGWRRQIVKLYEGDDHEKPVWYEHPVHKDKVDVVVMEVDGVGRTMLRYANDLHKDPVPQFRTGMDVFILGYPRGLTGGGKFPIWKRGSLATEPDVDIDMLPLSYVDTATREGMSGAPVYASEVGSWTPERGGGKIVGAGRRFLGIYSGRIGGSDAFQAQLGQVWKEQAIIEIIEGKQAGRSSWALVKRNPESA